MKRSRYVQRLAAALGLLLVINIVLSALPPYPAAVSVRAAQKETNPPGEDNSDPAPLSGGEDDTDPPAADGEEDGTEPAAPTGEEHGTDPATPSSGENGTDPPTPSSGDEGTDPPNPSSGETGTDPNTPSSGENGTDPPTPSSGENGTDPSTPSSGKNGTDPTTPSGGETGTDPSTPSGGETGTDPSTPSGAEDNTEPESSPSSAEEATPSDAPKESIQPGSLNLAAAGLRAATPSEAVEEIVFVDVPPLVALDTDEAENYVWQAAAWTDSGDELWCDLQWNDGSIHDIDWDEPGVYAVQMEIIPPEGYVLKGPVAFHNVVISIHPPGTSQVLDVFTRVSRRMGHTWTFAMKAGQDMSPLVEMLESIDTYYSIIDTTNQQLVFSARWDFSEVNPDKPGCYRIYRTLELDESSVPDGISPQDIYLPEYWENLPVLFSVEEPGGPQLYEVIESPYNFFGSYARLSEEELDALKVWYSIDGGAWVRQTNEGLMETHAANFSIDKMLMREGHSYSFRLELGDFVSEELTVEKQKGAPVWFTYMIDGSRDGTVEVEFPDISQPPPTDDEPAQPAPTDSPGVTGRPDSDGSGNDSSSGSQGLYAAKDPAKAASAGMGGGPGETELADLGEPPHVPLTGAAGLSQAAADGGEQAPADGGEQAAQAAASGNTSGHPETEIRRSGAVTQADRQARGLAAGSLRGQGAALFRETTLSQEQAAADSRISLETGGTPGIRPEEEVTRWTTQISGIRVRKLIEMYPEWIRFQKEEVSILLSSQWLKEQQMRDSDVLTVSVSPEDGHTVTISINQKVPKTSPVFQVTVDKKGKGRFTGAVAAAAAVALSFALSGAITVHMRKRR